MNIFARDNTNDGGGWDIRFEQFTGLEPMATRFSIRISGAEAREAAGGLRWWIGLWLRCFWMSRA